MMIGRRPPAARILQARRIKNPFADALRARIALLPFSPGCYLFSDKQGELLYVGKSKSLRNRVRSYFARPQEGKLARLVHEIASIDWIQTDTESDALILECRLIKTHTPPYNAQLKRKRSFCFLRIDPQTPFSPLSIVREKACDRAHYIGYFYSEDDALETLEMLHRLWQTPICNKSEYKSNGRACLHGHTGRCCAPCVQRGTPDAYAHTLREIIQLFHHNNTGVLHRLERQATRLDKRMRQEAKCLAFEDAAQTRRKLNELQRFLQRVPKLGVDFQGQDVYVFFRAYRETDVTLYYVCDGVALHRYRQPVDSAADEELLSAFIEDIYQKRFSLQDTQLPLYLLEIMADKHYVPLSKKLGTARTVLRLQKEMSAYLQGAPSGFSKSN